jgi:hypothetical protein
MTQNSSKREKTASTFGDLEDERSLGIEAALEQAENLLQIIEVIRANRVLRVSASRKSFGRRDHGWIIAAGRGNVQWVFIRSARRLERLRTRPFEKLKLPEK